MRRNAWYFSVLWTSAIGLMLLTTSASAQTITTSQVPGASHTTAADINDAGSITGDFSDGSGRHGLIRDSDGSFTEFDVSGATTTFPLRINAAGTVTGNIQKPGFPAVIVGFVLDRNGVITEFRVPTDFPTSVKTIPATE